MELFGLRPMRCRSCRHRFYKRRLPPYELSTPPGEPEARTES